MILRCREAFLSNASFDTLLALLEEASKSIRPGVHILTLVNESAAGETLFETMLKESNTEEQFLKLQYLFDNLPTKMLYSNHWVKVAKAFNPEHGLDYVIRLLGVHVRDERPETHLEHVVTTVMKLDWVEGLDQLLSEDPTLVNVPVITLDKNLRMEFVTSLLFEAINLDKSEDMIARLLAAKPAVVLKNIQGNNVFHVLAANKNACKKYPALMKWLSVNGTVELANALNKGGATPVEIATAQKNQVFLKLLQEKFFITPGPRVVNHNTFFGQSPEVKRAIMAQQFKPQFPFLAPYLMCTLLIGKAMRREQNGRTPFNGRLFTDVTCLQRYIETMMKYTLTPFVINAIVGTTMGYHVVNAIIIVHDSKHVNGIVINSLGSSDPSKEGFHSEITSPLKKKGVDCALISTQEVFQHSNAGCHVLTAYICGKLSHFSYEKANELYQNLSQHSLKERTSIEHLPLSLGIITIAQSMTLMRKALISKSTQEANGPINHRSENTETVTKPWLRLAYDPAFVDFPENKWQNHTLLKKVENRKQQAELSAELQGMDEIEAVATVLGIKDMREAQGKSWETDAKNTMEELDSWSSFESSWMKQ